MSVGQPRVRSRDLARGFFVFELMERRGRQVMLGEGRRGAGPACRAVGFAEAQGALHSAFAGLSRRRPCGGGSLGCRRL